MEGQAQPGRLLKAVGFRSDMLPNNRLPEGEEPHVVEIVRGGRGIWVARLLRYLKGIQSTLIILSWDVAAKCFTSAAISLLGN